MPDAPIEPTPFAQVPRDTIGVIHGLAACVVHRFTGVVLHVAQIGHFTHRRTGIGEIIQQPGADRIVLPLRAVRLNKPLTLDRLPSGLLTSLISEGGVDQIAHRVANRNKSASGEPFSRDVGVDAIATGGGFIWAGARAWCLLTPLHLPSPL